MNSSAPPQDGTCFFEADPNLTLARRAGAEAVGSFLLTFTVVASTIAWSGGDPIGSVARGLSVGPTLTALILLFGSISGGHYNPLITLAQGLGGRRGVACLAAYITAQVAGAVIAARLAVAAFGSPLAGPVVTPSLSTLLGSEIFATTGLLLLVVGAPRMRPAGVGPFAIGGFITMTIAALPGAPAANPIVVAAALASGLAAAPLTHLACEAVGLLLALVINALVSPKGDPSHAR